MRLEELDYDLPHDRIAQTPVEPRDAARLLVDRGVDGDRSGVAHRHVHDLPELLRPGDVVVVNDSKVMPARLRLRRATGGVAEVLLLERLCGRRWSALVRPGRKLVDGEQLVTDDDVPLVRVGARLAGGVRAVELLADDPGAALDRYGELPLPPYITTPPADMNRYQTVYARRPGSAAAPTAGLHVTAELLARLEARGIDVVAVELVVGLDTFAPITEQDPLEHRIHSERYHVTAAAMERCAAAQRVVAIGTTAVRAIESAAATGELEGSTDLFIRRGHQWQQVDVLMTNFHLPRTTLLLMIDAFVGPRWRELYATALGEGYRFASFGDAMLLERRAG